MKGKLDATAVVWGLIMLAGLSSGCAVRPSAGPTALPTAAATPALYPTTAHTAAPTSTPAVEFPTETPSPEPVPVNQRVGWIIFATYDGTDLFLLSPDGGVLVGMGLGSLGRPRVPAWSFDWQRIAFVAGSVQGYNGIYVVDAGCVDLPEGCLPHVRNLTEDTPGFYGYPTWSPDGQQIAYSFRSTTDSLVPFQIWVMNADGSDKTCLTSVGGTDPDWSPDGSMIAFTSELTATTAEGNIAIIQADGSGLRLLSDSLSDSFQSAWSPDGTRLAFVSTTGQNPLEADSYQIFVIGADGTGLRQVTGGELHGGWPGWSPDGTRIMFEHTFGGLYLVNVDGSNPTELSNTVGGYSPCWYP